MFLPAEFSPLEFDPFQHVVPLNLVFLAGENKVVCIINLATCFAHWCDCVVHGELERVKWKSVAEYSHNHVCFHSC